MTAIDTCPVPLASSDLLIDRTERLIWSLLDDELPEELDDELPEEGVIELENILREQPNLCKVYVNCVQIHVDLGDALGSEGEALTNAPPPLRIYSEEQC